MFLHIDGLSDYAQAFSPRARGCSDHEDYGAFQVEVFPACAGMFLEYNRSNPNQKGFPRVRGDVPFRVVGTMRFDLFSPRARGCS